MKRFAHFKFWERTELCTPHVHKVSANALHNPITNPNFSDLFCCTTRALPNCTESTNWHVLVPPGASPSSSLPTPFVPAVPGNQQKQEINCDPVRPPYMAAFSFLGHRVCRVKGSFDHTRTSVYCIHINLCLKPNSK